MYQNTAV